MYIHTTEIHNPNAARKILPIIFKHVLINSVLDVGCGTGTWLQAVEELGVHDCMGIDGDWVNRSQLKISSHKFLSFDLTKSLELNRKFDLVICLEVVEHLPLSSAETIVKTLVSHADTILFSAAIPKQGGQRHINEQSVFFWVELFKKHGYHFYDMLRPLIWRDDSIEWWYRQNIFLVSRYEQTITSASVINDYVHPGLLYNKMEKLERLMNDFNALLEGHRSPLLYFKLFFRSLFRNLSRFNPFLCLAVIVFKG